MKELSLNVLDIAQNSLAADADLIAVTVARKTADHTLVITIADNGRGMTAEQVQQVRDPFFTTRTTRSVGMGVPLFRMAAEMTGGSLDITSEVSVGTTVTAVFYESSIDCMPLGDMADTVITLIRLNPDADFVYTQSKNEKSVTLDTRELRNILGDVPLSEPSVIEWIKEYLNELLESLTL